MAFSEELKKQVRRNAFYHCCICERPDLSIEVHHILSQEEGGLDIIDNAAPLCPSCHSNYGGNKEKRARIKEKRDFWYEQVLRRYSPKDVESFEQLGQKVFASGQDIVQIKTDLRQYVEEIINKITPQNLGLAVSSILSSAVVIPQVSEITSAMAMWEKLSKLETENEKLRAENKFSKSLFFRNAAYWAEGEKDPYCSRCWEREGRAIHLHQKGNPAFYNCPNCKCGSVKARPEFDTPPRASTPRPANWI